MENRLQSRLAEVISTPQQRGAEFWQQSSDILEKHPNLLKEVSVNESHFLITPSYIPADGHTKSWTYGSVSRVNTETKAEKQILMQQYALAARINKGQKYEPGLPLYLIINNNITAPVLQINNIGGGLMTLDGLWSEVSTKDDRTVKKVLDFIESAMAIDQKEYDTLASRRRSAVKKRRLITAGVVGAMLIGGGVTTGILEINQRNEAREQSERAEFDALNLEVATEGISVADISYLDSQPNLFTQYDIPSARDSDSLQDLRRVTVQAGDDEECKSLDRKIETDEVVQAVTDGPDGQVYLAVSPSGKIQICAFEAEGVSGEATTSYDVALQVRTSEQG